MVVVLRTSARGKSDRDIWWWTENVQEALGDKKDGHKMETSSVEKHTRNVRRAIAIAKAEAMQEWYDKLNTKNGAREV